jgi:pilus assembly protein CpaE
MATELTVMLVELDEALNQSAQDLLKKMKGTKVVSESDKSQDWAGNVRKIRPDILMAGLNTANDYQKTLHTVESLKIDYPEMAVFLCSSSNSTDIVMSAMRAGAQEFLNSPLNAQDFDRAFQKVKLIHDQSRSKSSDSGKVISLYSAKGGQGTSTLAVNLSIAIAKTESIEPVVIDLDLHGSDVPSLMDLNPKYNILDARGPDGNLDLSQLQSCVIRHDSGATVLAGPTSINGTTELSAVHIKQVLTLLKTMYSAIVIDTTHELDSKTQAAFEMSDYILLPVVPSVSSVRTAKRTMDTLRGLGYDDKQIKVIINRTTKKDRITTKDIAKALDTNVFWTIPNDYRIVSESIDTGKPFTDSKRLSSVGKSVVELASILIPKK